MKVIVALALVAAGCHQDAPDSDRALLRDVPGGNFALFGGDYTKLESIVHAPNPPAYMTWLSCFTAKRARLAGALAIVEDGLSVRFAMRGAPLTVIKTCAEQAKLQPTLSPDGKYMSVGITAGDTPILFTFLTLRDGAVYFRQDVTADGVRTPERSALEADVKRAVSASAIDDDGLMSLADKADHTKTLWIAARGTRTPLADKIADLTLSANLGGPDNETTIDVRLVTESLAEEALAGFAHARGDAANPPAVKAILDGVTLRRDGNRLHATVHVTDAQLAALQQLADFVRPHGP